MENEKEIKDRHPPKCQCFPTQLPVCEARHRGLIDASVFVFIRYSTFWVSLMCLLPFCPLSLSLMRLDAWLHQHLPWVATGLIPPGSLLHFVLHLSLPSLLCLLCLWAADGSRRRTRGRRGGREGDRRRRYPGVAPLPAQQNELY